MKTKIYKALSIMLALAVILSTCICAIGTVSAATATYYVSATGNDETGTGEATAPFLTVKGAVAKAIADGRVAGDTVTIKVGTDAGAAETVNGSGMAVYEFDMIVESANPAAKSTLTYGRGGRVSNSLVGTTTYKNVKIYNNGEQNTSVQLYRSDVVFESDVEFDLHQSSQIVCSTNSNTGAARETAGQNIVIKNSNLTQIQLSTFNTSNEVFTEAVNLTFNSTKSATIFFNGAYLGNASGATTYKKLVNVYLQSGVGTAIKTLSATFEEGLNIINSTGAAVTGTLPASAWLLNDETGIAGCVTATATPGVFAVSLANADKAAKKKDVVAVAADGTETAVVEGQLTLAAGTYTIKLKDKASDTATYYVSANGNDETGTGAADAPFLTVKGAVAKAIADGYGIADVVTIKVGTDEGDAESVNGSGMAVYEFDMIVESANPAAKSTLTYGRGGRFSNNVIGTTTYKNVIIDNKGEQNTSVQLYRSDVVFEKDVEFNIDESNQIVCSTNSNSSGARETAGQNIVIKNSNLTQIQLSTFNTSNEVFTAPVNLTFNTTKAATIFFNGSYLGAASGATTYKKLVNVYLQSGAGTAIKTLSATFEEGLNIINSTGAAVTGALPENAWVINNETGIDDAIAATATPGVFAASVAGGDKAAQKKDIVAVAADGTEIAVVNGKLTLAAGTYTIKLKDKAAGDTATYYVSATGNDETGTGEATAPFLTVKGAVAKAIADGYGVNDVVTIKVGTEGAAAETVDGSGMAVYEFDMIVESANSAAKSTLTYGRGGRFANSLISTTTYKNVILDNKGEQNTSVQLYRSDVVFEASVEFILHSTSQIVLGTNSNSTWRKTPGQTVVIGGGNVSQIQLVNFNAAADRFTHPLNLTFNSTATVSIYFNSAYLGKPNGSTVYEKLVNVTVEKAADVRLMMFGNATFEEGLNIINKGSFTIGSTTTGYTDLPENAWIINDKTAVAGFITPTATPGVFDVKVEAGQPELQIFDAEGTAYAPVDGKLTLPAGTYDVGFKKDPETVTLYVNGATVDGADGTEAKPYNTVADAVTAAVEAGYTNVDTVIVKVVGDNTKLGTLPSYPFALVVEGAGEQPSKLNINSDKGIAKNPKIATKYDNLIFLRDSDGGWMEARDADVIFGDKVSFDPDKMLSVNFGNFNGNGGYTETIAANSVLTFHGVPGIIYTTNSGWSGRTYTGLITLNIDDPDGKTLIHLNSTQGGSTKYKDVVINLNNIEEISFGTMEKVTMNGGLFIINNTAHDLTQAVGYNTMVDEKFIINNLSGDTGLVTVPGEFDGEVKINADFANVKVTFTNAEGTPVEIDSEGYATLEYGIYTIDAECINHAYDNACDADCNRCGETRTPGDHVYDNDTDADCNECGAVRSLRGTGLYKEDGVYYYYEDGVKSTATTLVKYEGKWFYVVKGKWDSKISNTLVKYSGKWFWIVGGKWDSKITDLKKYSGKWFYIENGKWNDKIDTLHKINGKWFLVKKGKWDKTTGIVEYKGKDFYVVGGKWKSQETLYKKGSKYYAIKGGKWNKTKTIVKYKGKKFYCNKGYAQLSFSGKVKIGSKTYTVKKGKIA